MFQLALACFMLCQWVMTSVSSEQCLFDVLWLHIGNVFDGEQHIIEKYRPMPILFACIDCRPTSTRVIINYTRTQVSNISACITFWQIIYYHNMFQFGGRQCGYGRSTAPRATIIKWLTYIVPIVGLHCMQQRVICTQKRGNSCFVSIITEKAEMV